MLGCIANQGEYLPDSLCEVLLIGNPAASFGGAASSVPILVINVNQVNIA